MGYSIVELGVGRNRAGAVKARKHEIRENLNHENTKARKARNEMGRLKRENAKERNTRNELREKAKVAAVDERCARRPGRITGRQRQIMRMLSKAVSFLSFLRFALFVLSCFRGSDLDLSRVSPFRVF